MRFLHTMLRVKNLDDALKFYCDVLGFKEYQRYPNEKGRYTNVYLIAPEDTEVVESSLRAGRPGPLLELTYNWDEENYGEARFFGHIAVEVEDIYAKCAEVLAKGVVINRPPRDGKMAFIRSPDRHSIEFLQKGEPLKPSEPWASMPNVGTW
ncbi:VOC family protein [Bradyrhizobium ottawaense]|uniref:VOC family protein n=1 Tax=Bradyrhizobium ottawaense TaxID=931866 RepID=UPI0038377F72